MDRNFLGMVGLLVSCILALFALKLAPMFREISHPDYFAQNAIQGSEITHKGVPYTLNFEQQKHLIAYLNQSKPTTTPTAVPAVLAPLDVAAITIFRFDAPPVEIRPLFYAGEELVYSAPALYKEGLLRDTTKGALQQLLAQTFDP